MGYLLWSSRCGQKNDFSDQQGFNDFKELCVMPTVWAVRKIKARRTRRLPKVQRLRWVRCHKFTRVTRVRQQLLLRICGLGENIPLKLTANSSILRMFVPPSNVTTHVWVSASRTLVLRTTVKKMAPMTKLSVSAQKKIREISAKVRFLKNLKRNAKPSHPATTRINYL